MITFVVRLLHGVVVGVALVVALFLVQSAWLIFGIVIIAPIAMMPWVYMPALERSLMRRQQRDS